jgi:radical SAM superfamily enzyme YgiQ (UPF0313 family)
MSKGKTGKRRVPVNPRDRLAAEKGTIIKDWGGRLPIALVYPNSYYLGMSNLGIQAIYGLLNRYPDVVCERLFFEKGGKTLPFALESHRPLTDFALIAFSVSYELDYFNVVEVLKSSGIPLYAAERDGRHPLVIAGGPCITANPMPLAPFCDCLCIGEGEAILPHMISLLSELAGDREALLQELSRLPGLYVPACSGNGKIKRQWLHKLDDFPCHSIVLTEDTELGDLFLLEVERGCGWGCRFCLVCSAFSPVRFRSAGSILEQAREGLRYRKRIGLVGPAVTSHSDIEQIMDGLLEMGAGISISSLRINPISPALLERLARGGARNVTLAPEAGTEHLRRLIKKRINEEDILAAIGAAADCGIRQLKLYFMAGLPGETDEDIEGIIRLTLNARSIVERRRSGTRLTLNISPFVPKAGTPFQWLPMESVAVLEQRLSRLKNELSPKGIRINAESPAWSEVQAVLSRGDATLSGVLAGMDGFTLSQWRKTTAKHGIDTDFHAHRKWETEDKLPWDMIESGPGTGKLISELRQAF